MGVGRTGGSSEPVEVVVIRFNTKDQIVKLPIATDKAAKPRTLRRRFGQQSELRGRLLKHAVTKNKIRQTDDALAENRLLPPNSWPARRRTSRPSFG